MYYSPRKWSKKEEEFMKNHYNKDMTMEETAKKLGRTKSSIQNKSVRMGLTANRSKLTKKDIKYIIENYIQISTNQIAKTLSVDPKTVRAILKQYNLKNPRSRTSVQVPWTKEEEEYLRKNYRMFSYSILSEKMGRSVKSIEKKALLMNLGRKGRPVSSESTPEFLCREILEDLALDYEKEFPIGNFSVDYYIPRYNLCVEVQGDYWHYNKDTNENKPNSKQKEIIEKDKRKKDEILKAGHKLLYLWENDLINNEKKCKRELIDALLPNPVNCWKPLKLIKLQSNLKR